jgi:hypothetical protein
MKDDYTTLKDKTKEVDQKYLGEVSPPLTPVLPDSSKREENLKAIIDTILCMVPRAVVLSMKNIDELAPDVKPRQAVARQRKQKDGLDKRQLKLDFGKSEQENIGGGK